MTYKTTELWRRLENGGEATKPLITEYDDFRKKAGQLTSLIPKTLADLTVHDISHLDGLWDTASLLIDESFELNPLEIFIFGCAVLLHDSALCAESYGGLDELRSTEVWKDTRQLLIERGFSGEKEIETQCDFQAVRTLHAEQAGYLATKTWTIENTGESISLISNDTLRNSYGEIIGKIASSHHWGIEELQTRLPPQIGVVGDMPSDWSINPIKIACMLRCADALHISKDRAPDFLHALTKRMGIPHSHWQAQNWLAKATKLNSDASGETIVVTSTKPFDANNDQAWWVAYELIELAGREIEASNELLDSISQNGCSSFIVKKIAGCRSPKELSNYIRTESWEPSPIELRVSDIKSLVDKLGGQSLYGASEFSSQFIVVLRELIQNARDAINARSVKEPNAQREILVQLQETDDSYELSISDTGCGMSRAVLTGPLLDFGSSFWTNDLVRSEFPSLKSDGFRSSGKFGIGFYSSFMISESVQITSRKFLDGLDKSNKLVFRNGLSLRPMLIAGAHLDGMQYSTEVKLSIGKASKDISFEFDFGASYVGTPANKVGLEDAIKHIAQFGGIRIDLKRNENAAITLVSGTEVDHCEPFQFQIDDWARTSGVSLTAQNVEEIKAQMRPICEADPTLGHAALNPYPSRNDGLGAKTIGGLRTNLNGGASEFLGFIDHHPDSAKRNPGKARANQVQLKKWADTQIKLLEQQSISELHWHYIGLRLSRLELDPSSHLYLPVVTKDGLQFLGLERVVSLILNDDVYVVLERELGLFAEERDAVSAGLYPRISDVFGVMRLFSHHENSKESDFSIRSCLERALKKHGKTLVFETTEMHEQSIRFGMPMQIGTLSVARNSIS